ncbi:MAG TPA: DUF3857 domain-containing protein [Patescibacteria group bacterium]|nr:DUF3857 domain-containing protein [Patescibacteria group bacterium]
MRGGGARFARRGTAALAALAALVTAGALAEAFLGDAYARETVPPWPEITPAERDFKTVPGDPDAPAVILRTSRDGRIFKRGSDTSNFLEYHWRLKILNDRGAAYAEVQIPAGKYSRVSEVEGRTIRPDGTIIPVPEDQIFRKMVTRARGYRELAYVFHFPAVEPGVIVEYRYQRVVTSIAFIPPWSFSGPEYTLLSQVSQAVPQIANYRVLCYHCPDPKPAQTPWRVGTDNGTRFEWTVRNLAPLREEEWMPPDRVAGTRLEMVLQTWRGAYWAGIERADTFINDWDTAARFAAFGYQAVIKDGQGTLKSLAKDWTQGLTDKEAIVRAVASHVQRDFRYLPGGDVYGTSRRIDDLARDASADNEEKAVLLAGALQAVGVKTSMALVAGRDHGPLYDNFYSLTEFSHVIVFVPEGDVGRWIDPTVTWAPFGFLSWRDSGAGALLLKPGGGTTVVLPQVTGVGLTRYDLTLRPRTDGSAEIEGTLFIDGEDAVEMRDDLIPASEVERHDMIRDWLRAHGPDGELADLSMEDLDDVDKPLRLKIRILVRGLITRTEDLLVVGTCLFDCYARNPLSHGARTLPFFVDRGRRRMETVTIVPPEGFTATAIPDPGTASSAIGAMTFGCDRKDDGTVSCLRAFTLPRGRVPVGEADGVRTMFDAIVELDRSGIALEATPQAKEKTR